jgi:hypothetical protein
MTEIHFSFWAFSVKTGIKSGKIGFQPKTKKPNISADMPGFSSFFLVLVYAARAGSNPVGDAK